MTIRTFFTLAAVLVMLVALADPAFAQDTDAEAAGSNILVALRDAITGNIGFIIGLGITILGLWTWIINQETGAGITMIIGGVLITLVPGIFTGARDMMFGVVQTLGGGTDPTAIRGK